VGGVPRDLEWLFWDSDPSGLDLDAHAAHILPRVIEFGGLAEVRWLLSAYGPERIHGFLRERGHPELSDRTLAFWRAFFHAGDETWASPPAWRKDSSAPWID